ncbi:MAG: G1 family glutamic endopeptidase [Solirubrobacteraceae bacterium]
MTRYLQSRSHLKAALTVAVVVTLAFAVLSLSHHGHVSRQTDAPFGGYAGYVWYGHVLSVRGAWQVPAIIDTSRPGFATSWVGVQGTGSRAPFIQVGTAELRGYSPEHTIEDRYWAFWSDTAQNYHPQYLFEANPGDRLSATVALSGGSWTLTISDSTNHKTATRRTGEDHAPLNLAQWTQEDAVTSTGARYAYPSLTTVSFASLLVNATVPRYASLYSTWMSIDGRYLAPSPLHDGAFYLKPATLTRAGKYALSLVANSPDDHQFGYELERWTATTPKKIIETSISRLTATLSAQARALRAASLPPSVKRTAVALVRQLATVIAQATPPSHISPNTLDTWRNRLTYAASEARYTEHLFRRSLRLPELP